MKVIEIKNLWWKYQGRNDFALKNINLEINDKEIVGIMGKSGAGKTSLCLTLNGIIPQRLPGIFKGEVKVLGMNTLYCDVNELAKHVGIVFEDPEIQFIMSTVEDEIVLGLENLKLTKEEIKERLEWALTLVGLDKKYLKRRPLELSGGEKQRVAIASIIALRPRILVFDEPTSDLDPKGKNEVFIAIERIREELGITIVIVEHESDFLMNICDRIVVMDNGRIVIEGTPEEVFSRYDLMKWGIKVPEVIELKRKFNVPLTCNDINALVKDRLLRINLRDIDEKRESKKRVYGDVIIKCNNIYFKYPSGTIALRGVNLTIREGEFIAIVGPNGSGKSTLAKILCGLLRPTNGSVYVYGKEPHKIPKIELCKIIGYVFQNPDHQLFNQSVYDEIAFGLRNLGFKEDEIRERVENLTRLLNLSKLIKEHPFFLSKGERRRLALAAILALEPKIIIVDEPTTGQDYMLSLELLNLLKEYNEKGHTVIIISHSIPLLVKYVKRLIVMYNGKIIADGDPHVILANDSIVERAHLVVPKVVQLSKSIKKLIPNFPIVISIEELEELLNYLSSNKILYD